MPKNVPLSNLDEEKIESGGGLAKATERDREIIYKQFLSWVSDQSEENRDISLYEDFAPYLSTCRLVSKYE